jgi:hypothetical protein
MGPILHLLNHEHLNHEHLTYDHHGRPFRLTNVDVNVVTKIIA